MTEFRDSCQYYSVSHMKPKTKITKMWVKQAIFSNLDNFKNNYNNIYIYIYIYFFFNYLNFKNYLMCFNQYLFVLFLQHNTIY